MSLVPYAHSKTLFHNLPLVSAELAEVTGTLEF